MSRKNSDVIYSSPCDGIAMAHDGMCYVLAQRDLIADIVETHALNHSPDNIDVDERGLLWIAGHPDAFAYLDYGKDPEKGVNYINAAEIHVEGDWTYVADNFIDLVAQIGS